MELYANTKGNKLEWVNHIMLRVMLAHMVNAVGGKIGRYLWTIVNICGRI